MSRGRLAPFLALALFPAALEAQTRQTEQASAAAPVEDRSEWQLRADSHFMAYAVQTPRSPVRLARRRFVQTVGFSQAIRLGDLRAPWTVRVAFDARLDQELGDVCTRDEEPRCLRETDVASRRDFQVLARITRLDLPEARVEIAPPGGRHRLRLGRQILFDPAGFLRLDGARATSELARWASVDAYAGLFAHEASFGGPDGFMLQGDLRFDLPDDLASERAPFVAEPTRTWVVGGTLSVGDARVVRAELVGREVRDVGGAVAARRAGFALRSRPVDPLGLRVLAMWDPTDGTLVDGVAEVELRTPRGLVRASGRRSEPRFDLGSIWAWFDLVPTDVLSLDGLLRLGPRWQISGGARARWTRLDAPVLDAGLDLGLDWRRGSRFFGIGGTLWAGSAGETAFIRVDGGRRVGVADLYTRGSVWHFAHPWQETLYGTSVALAAGAAALLTDHMRLRFELEWMHNQVAGHRVRGLASLTLRVWR